ncbi:MAG: hypothetical protein P8R54_07070 [Myxococcota bacterium]|nr:hypothetical protein [Myxococcota bacterium]
MRPALIILPLLLACGDKESDTATAGAADDTATETLPEESASTYTAGSYRVETFSIITDATVGQDIDGDGEADNKLPSVLNLAAGITGEPLAPGEINKSIVSDLKKGNIVLLTDAEQVGVELRYDVLLGLSDKSGAVSVDPLSYGDDGQPNSRFAGVFDTQTEFTVSAGLAELPFSLISGEDPVLIPLELVVMTGTLEDGSTSGILGGAVPADAFVDDVIESIIPTGEDYDSADYLDMTRDELIDFIRDFANQDGVADITLEDGRKAVSAAVQFTATPATW